MEDSAELLARWQVGDQTAAATLFRRYFTRLHALARKRLPQRMAARLDAEDVVQSVFQVFFERARDGRYVLEHAGDLWRLLAVITLAQIKHELKRHNAAKRSLTREQLPLPWRDAVDEENLWLTGEPAPEEAAMLADGVRRLLEPLSREQRRSVELRLQGFTFEEIAAQLGRHERTVRRTLDLVKQRLEERIHSSA